MGYDAADGTVAAYSVAVTTSSSGGTPPLLVLTIWYHHWAPGWRHFVFFQMSGANFFFKINTTNLNVNIDHLRDSPAMGSVEVGSYLQAQLPDARAIDRAARVPWKNGEPYLLTYIAENAQTKVYHIHADCLGWTQVGQETTVERAALVVAYRTGDTSYVLFYQGASE